MISRALWLVLLGMSACHNQPPRSGPGDAPSPAPQSAPAPAPARERSFGAGLQVEGEPVDVASIMADPEPYLRRTVKCRGTIARVCQAAGCWLELRAAAGGDGLRVPMANHAFFVPQDIVGKVAVVEGRLGARQLLEAERAHLTGEGLKATGPLFLEATGVVVR